MGQQRIVPEAAAGVELERPDARRAAHRRVALPHPVRLGLRVHPLADAVLPGGLEDVVVVVPGGLTVHTPDLDDVFLALTGNPTDEKVTTP